MATGLGSHLSCAPGSETPWSAQSAPHLSDFFLAPTGTCPESVAGPHRAVSPCALLRKATLPAVAAQWAQLLWHEPGECHPHVQRF